MLRQTVLLMIQMYLQISGKKDIIEGIILTNEERGFMKKTADRLCVFVGIFFLLLTCACGKTAEKSSPGGVEAGASSTVADMAADTMEVHFLDVGQADSILIKTSSSAMLVDAGKNEDGEKVVSYLQQQGIERLDYVIGTHPHEDHIGGLDNVIQSFDIGEVILPEKTHTSRTYMDVLQAIQDKGLSITLASAGQEYSLGNASFTILSPKEGVDYGDELNNWSIGIRVVHGQNCFVMTGDAERDAEEDILASGLELKADVWKAGHHGSETSNSDALLQAVNPQYAVISCGRDNSYGHPDFSVLQKFSEKGIQVYRTDEQGTIIASSDGTAITWNMGESTSMKAGDRKTEDTNEDLEPENQAAESRNPQEEEISQEVQNPVERTGDEETLVHVTESGSRYHRAGCQYLNDSDREITLAEARNQGLEPCKKCNPPQN